MQRLLSLSLSLSLSHATSRPKTKSVLLFNAVIIHTIASRSAGPPSFVQSVFVIRYGQT